MSQELGGGHAYLHLVVGSEFPRPMSTITSPRNTITAMFSHLPSPSTETKRSTSLLSVTHTPIQGQTLNKYFVDVVYGDPFDFDAFYDIPS